MAAIHIVFIRELKMYDSNSKKFSKVKDEYICEEYLSTIGLYELEGSFDEAIELLTKRKLEYNGYDSYEIKCERDYDGERELQVWCKRKMTADEINEFNIRQEQQKQNELEWKRRQLEQLKKELGE